MSMGTTDKSPVHEVFSAAGKFCIIFLGSVIIGAMTALIAAFIVKRQATYVPAPSAKVDEWIIVGDDGEDDKKTLR